MSQAIERLLLACDELLEYRAIGIKDHGECVCVHCKITEAAAAVRSELDPKPVPAGELLPCPFCGGPATVCQSSNDSRWWVGGCEGPCEVLPTVEVASRDGAVESWNRRAELAREHECPTDVGVAANCQTCETLWTAAADASHTLENLRIWGGMGWKWYQPTAGKAWKILTDAMMVARAARGEKP